jgi:hypothetical protein
MPDQEINLDPDEIIKKLEEILAKREKKNEKEFSDTSKN